LPPDNCPRVAVLPDEIVMVLVPHAGAAASAGLLVPVNANPAKSAGNARCLSLVMCVFLMGVATG
jgi:hypothetical protein